MKRVALIVMMLAVIAALPASAKGRQRAESPKAEKSVPRDVVTEPTTAATAAPKPHATVHTEDEGCFQCTFLWSLVDGAAGTNLELTYIFKASSCSLKHNCAIIP